MKKFAFVSSTEESGFEYWKEEYATKNEAIDNFIEQANDYGVLEEILNENNCETSEDLYKLEECNYFGRSQQEYLVILFFGTKTKDVYNTCRQNRSEMMNGCGLYESF